MANDIQLSRKRLLLITNHFPFGSQEPFLHNEFEYLKKYFLLTIVTSDCTSPMTTEAPFDFPVYRVRINANISEKIFNMILAFSKKFFWKELSIIFKERTNIFFRLQYCAFNAISAISFYRRLKRLNVINLQDLVYTYWQNYKVLGIGFLLARNDVDNIPLVSRVHGYDLFNERVDLGKRQAFKSEMDSHISKLFFASKYGLNYYKSHFGFSKKCNYEVSYLGVERADTVVPYNAEFGLSLISVSNVIPLKRIDLIINALELIEEFTVEWVHFGTGSSLEYLNTLALDQLGGIQNITYHFRGHIENSALHEYYKNNAIDAFITTSLSEGGCPVSIQEAFSYGIPSVCTSVGGITEMIEDGLNGYLMPEYPTPMEIKNTLVRLFVQKQEGQLEDMKQNALKTWERLFDADTNYEIFAKRLYNLI